jgi:hypothetical protein
VDRLVDQDTTRINALLSHLGDGGDLRRFPGTRHEVLALVAAAGRRNLIAWERSRGRHVLTSAGRKQIGARRDRRATFSAKAMKAALGAVAVAAIWFATDVSSLLATQPAARLARPARAVPALASADQTRQPPEPAAIAASQPVSILVPGDGAGPLQETGPSAPAPIATRTASAPEATPAIAPTQPAKKLASKKRHRRVYAHARPDNPGFAALSPWAYPSFSGVAPARGYPFR